MDSTLSSGGQIFDSEQGERGRRYPRPADLARGLGIALRLLVLGLLSFGGLGDWLFGLVDGLAWWGEAIAFSALVALVGSLVATPVAFWRGYLHERRWGFSTQTLGGWVSDRAKGAAIGMALTVIPMFGLIASVHLFPSWWPLVAALGGAADVLVADASRRTTKHNAYVSGIGKTRRVVVWDTLLDRGEPGEVRLVVAHELGHRRFRHVAIGTAIAMAGTALFVLGLWVLFQWDELLAAIGADGPGDPRMIPFVLFAGAVAELALRPFALALSRRWERDADRFSLELTGDPEAYEATHRNLALSNLGDLDPPKAAYLFFFSHPTAPERLAAAR